MAQPDIADTPELSREQIVTSLIRPLEQQSAILGLPGIRRIDLASGHTGPIRIPKLLDPGNADPSPHEIDVTPETATSLWKGENEKIGEDEESFDDVTLLPPQMRSIKIIVRMSNETVRMAFIDVASVAQQDMVRKVRRAMDRQFINGAGDGITMPKGLLQPGHGFNSIAASTWAGPDDVYDIVDVALGVDAVPSAWLMHPWNLTATRRWVGTDGHALLQNADAQDALAPRLAGYGVRTSTLFPKDRIMFGAWGAIATGIDQDVRVTALPEAFAVYDQWAVRIVMRADIKPLMPEAMVVATVPAATGPTVTPTLLDPGGDEPGNGGTKARK